MLQPGRSYGLVCVHALYYIMLLEKSGVLQTCQHCNAQEYNSIQQRDLAIKKYFHVTKQLYLHHLKIKPLLLQKPALENMIKNINGGGHKVTLPMRGPAKNVFFQGSLASVLLHFCGHSYFLDDSKNCAYDWPVPVFTCRHWAMKLAGPTTPPLRLSHAKWPEIGRAHV